MSGPQANPTRRVKITMTLDVPAEWTDSYIRNALHLGYLKTVTSVEMSSVRVEEVYPATDPNQERLF